MMRLVATDFGARQPPLKLGMTVDGLDGYLQSTLSRSSLPALKCGTYLAGTATLLPVFGLRPVRGGL